MTRDASEVPCRLLLVGMMGSGKSTIGRLLADATGWPYLDNDDLVARTRGATSRAIAERGGTDAVRAAESAALAIGLTQEPPCIIGVAAGTVLDPENRAKMRDGGIVVWLDADPLTLATRAVGGAHRPWLDDDPRSWMRATAERRAPLYAELADIHADTGSEGPSGSVRSIIHRLDELAGCPRGPRRDATSTASEASS